MATFVRDPRASPVSQFGATSTQHLPEPSSTNRSDDLTAPRPGSPGIDLTKNVGADTAWHAVWTRSRYEPRVCDELRGKEIDTFFPTFTKDSRWSDRTKRIAWPLFPGYCFARFASTCLPRVVRCVGVVAVLSNRGRPIPIPAIEIEALQHMVASGLPYDPCSQLVPGSRVRVVNGPLSGVVGRLVRRGTQDLLVLAVELLNSGARVEVSAWDVQPF